MGFTSVNKNFAGNNGSGTTLTVQLTGISAGDLVIVFAGHGAATVGMSVSDGTTSFTGLTERGSSQLCGRQFYLLSSVASGTVTYTVTYSSAVSERRIQAWAFSADGAVSFEQQAGTDGGFNTAASSGNLTTASALVMGSAYAVASTLTASAEQINGVAATDTNEDAAALMWYRQGVTMTGAATATYSADGWWVAMAASFTEAASALPFITTLGAQRI